VRPARVPAAARERDHARVRAVTATVSSPQAFTPDTTWPSAAVSESGRITAVLVEWRGQGEGRAVLAHRPSPCSAPQINRLQRHSMSEAQGALSAAEYAAHWVSKPLAPCGGGSRTPPRRLGDGRSAE